MSLLSLYKSSYPRVLTYMLQSTGYHAGPYLRWFWRTQDFDKVMRRRTLDMTVAARLLLLFLILGMFLQLAAGTALIVQWAWQGLDWGWQIGLAMILAYPIVWAHLVALPLALVMWAFVQPKHSRDIKRAGRILAGHQGVKIAIVGSYGKSSMKELLATVLAEGMRVAVSPDSNNLSIGHARFAQKLDGDEDVLILEFGDDRPGGLARMARRTHPTHAVITGLPARARKDFFSIESFVSPGNIFANGDSTEAKTLLTKQLHQYGVKGALGWGVSRIKVSPKGTSFTLSKDKQKLRLSSGLPGRHNVGPLAFAAAFGMQLGMTKRQVAAGVARTQPLEHRMQPLDISGALVIDDTCSANIENVRAGTILLKELRAKRKWYLASGLDGQGRQTAKTHHEIGQLIAEAKPDIVVLVANPVQQYIAAGLAVAGFRGEVRVAEDPLVFYDNLPHFIAAGDVVLMQGDWVDRSA